jgi:hypothetical protein
MSVFGLRYPTTVARASIAAFPTLAARLDLAKDRSSLEIVRLLDNAGGGSPSNLLSFIDRHLADSGPIGDRILRVQSPEAIAQALAELQLFAHLRSGLGNAVAAAPEPCGQRGNDINVTLDGEQHMIEVYTPLELAGWRLFEANLGRALRYLDVDRGYEIGFTVDATADLHDDPVGHFYYPYSFPPEKEIRAWFASFLTAAREWLLSDQPDRVLRLSGPGGVVQIDLELEALDCEASGRLIHGTWGGRSNSTRLVFRQCAQLIASSEWGRKLRAKLGRRQCGDAAPDRLRLLVLNFDLGDESGFEFMNSERFAARFSEFVQLLVDPSDLPYDAVLPALLGLNCGFGRVVVLDQQRASAVERFIAAAALDRPVEDPPPGNPAELFKELSEA